MQIEHLRRNLERRRLRYESGGSASEADFSQFTTRTGLQMPAQVRTFYSHCNGLTIVDPKTEIWSVARLERDSDGLVPFSIFDGTHPLAFDTRETNAAEQWDIVSCASREVVTKTMASFWGIKLFGWIDKRRPIWVPPPPMPPCDPPATS